MTRRQWLVAMASPMALSFGAESFADASGGVHAMELTLPSRLLTRKELEADVVVVGGGMAGVCAAIAAARNGASVVLIQDRPVLGGNSSSEIRMHIVGADCHGGRKDTDAR